MATPRRSRNLPPAMPQGEVIADFNNYEEAVAYVEKLVEGNFPAGLIAIVGKDLRTVERVRGKMSYARVALSGAVTGSWLGLLYGLFFGGSTDTSSVSSFATSGLGSSIFIGAGLGMLFQVIRFSISKRKRGFISQSSVVASTYQVQVPGNMVGEANSATLKTNP
ncbi:MAG: general stress protein [Micrococcales bacterium]